MARTPRTSTADLDAVVVTDADTPGLPALADSANLLAAVQADIGSEQLRVTQLIGERIGRRSIARMITKLLTVTDLLDLQRIKESKQYKGFVHIGKDGKSESITTWADYCNFVEGKSVEAIDLDIRNLNQIGEELFDSMRQVGIGPGKMREIRQLPEDSQSALIEAAREGDKETLIDLAEELILKHAKEKAELNKQLEDAQDEHHALSKVEADTSQKLRDAKLELERNQLRTVPWSDKVAPFQQEIGQRQRIIDEALVRHLQAVEALDVWLNAEITAQPDYDPESPVVMPQEILAVLTHLDDAINRSAHQVATARHELYSRFGAELMQAKQHLLQLEEQSA